MSKPNPIDAFNGLQAYFESYGINPMVACSIMASAIGTIRGMNSMSVVDQTLLDAITTGWEHGTSDYEPMVKPKAGKVV